MSHFLRLIYALITAKHGRFLKVFLMALGGIGRSIVRWISIRIEFLTLWPLILRALLGREPILQAWIEYFMQALTGIKIEAQRYLGRPLATQIQEQMKDLGEEVWNRVWGALAYDRPFKDDLLTGSVEDKAKAHLEKRKDFAKKSSEAALRYLGQNLAFQLSSWLGHVYASVYTDGRWKFVKDLPINFSWGLGLGWTSWMIIGACFQAMIASGTQQKYNKYFSPTLLSPAEALEAYRRGHTTLEFFIDTMRRHGFSDYLIDLYLKSNFKIPSESILWEMHRRNNLKDEDMRKLLEKMGYAPAFINAILAFKKDEVKVEILKQTAMSALEAFKKDYATEEDCKTALKNAFYTDDEIQLLINKAKIEKIKEKNLGASDLARALAREAVKEDLAVKILMKEGYSQDEAKMLLEHHMRLPTQGELEEAYELKVISEDDFRKGLKNLGYPDYTIDLIVATVNTRLGLKPEERPRVLTVSQVLALFRYGVISDYKCVERLKAMGYSEMDAYELVALEKKRMARPVPTEEEVEEVKDRIVRVGLTRSSILRAFRVGYFTKEETIKKLIEIGIPEGEAKTLVEIEERAIKLATAIEPRMLSPSNITAAYEKKIFDYDTALVRLQEHGFSVEDAADFLDLRLKVLSESEILSLYEKGLLTKEEAKQRLNVLFLHKEEVDLILASREKHLTERQRIEAYFRGYYTDEEIKSYLLQQGYSENEVEILIDLYRPTYTRADVLLAYRRGLITPEETKDLLKSLGYTDNTATFLIALQTV